MQLSYTFWAAEEGGYVGYTLASIPTIGRKAATLRNSKKCSPRYIVTL